MKRILFCCYLAGVCLLAACSNEAARQSIEIQGVTMGTLYTIKLVDPPAALQTSAVRAEIERLLQGINRRLSTYLPDSELSLLNAGRETTWLDASSELVEVLAVAQGISKETGGAFDVTVGPLVNLWGFGPAPGPEAVPSEQRIRGLMTRVGYTALELRRSPPAIRKRLPDLYIDLSAIAKGYAVDRLATYLESIGMADYMVEVGGEIRARGRNVQGGAWRIAVEKPLDDARVVHTLLNLQDSGLATSGDYRNYFESDGQRYSHTIDPRSGYPVTHTLASVTVVDASAMRADAMATALMVLGPEDGYELAERRGMAALFIVRTEDGFTGRVTTAFKPYQVVVPR